MLSGPEDQAALDQALLADWLRVYALPQQTVRLDSTSVAVYQDPAPPDGLMRHGVSKEHRPDLAQFTVMLASLDPLGLPLACQPVPGNRSDDLLYIPAYDAAMQALETRAVLVVGDTGQHEGGAGHAGAQRARGQRLPVSLSALEGHGPDRGLDHWITQALERAPPWQEVREVDERTGEITTLAIIDEWTREQGAGETTWTERVLVSRSVP